MSLQCQSGQPARPVAICSAGFGRQGRSRMDCHQAATSGLCPSPRDPRQQACVSAGQPAALRPLAAAASALVSSGRSAPPPRELQQKRRRAARQGQAPSGPGPPCVRHRRACLGCRRRVMTSFTLGTTSPPLALSATACAMGFSLRPAHSMYYSLRRTYCVLTCVMVLNLRPRGDT